MKTNHNHNYPANHVTAHQLEHLELTLMNGMKKHLEEIMEVRDTGNRPKKRFQFKDICLVSLEVMGIVANLMFY